MLAVEIEGIARIGDFHLLQHLADNHFDVLVVDRHALQAIDFLDLVDQVGSASASTPRIRKMSCGAGLPSSR
jgi:hypothetical protein